MPNYYPPAGGSSSGTASASSVDSAAITDGSIVNADINAAAGIALSKLASDPLARANHTGTQLLATISDAGTLAGLSAVASAQITDGTIAGGDLNSTIAIPSGATATTQTADDNSTKVSTTAYADTIKALKANIASPTLTGTPAAPTAVQGTSTTQIATTAMVQSEVTLLAPKASPTFTGTPTLPTGTIATTQSATDGSTKVATTAYVDTADALKANLASPTFTGTPVLPTGSTMTSQTALDRSTKVATTLYADRSVEAMVNGLGWSAPTGSVGVTFDRAQAPQGTRTVVTAVIYMTAAYIPTGTVISNFNCISAATASSCTHSWCALFNNSRVQLAATADDTSGNANFTADTTRTQAVATIASGASATFTTTYSGLHYIGVCVVFTGTAPTMRCDASGNTIINSLAPIMTGTSNTGQTTPNAFAFTANALTGTSNRDYVWLT